MEFALSQTQHLARADTAPKGQLYTCLDCAAPVKLRRGAVRAPHFAHLGETNCTGEGVIHHAAKLELARALDERERPFILHVPCCWPGCTQTIEVKYDAYLSNYNRVTTEQQMNFDDGTWIRWDVATLLRDEFEAGFEVYHHHRVSDGRNTKPMPNWVEVHAEPLLDDPYQLYMVKNDLPVNELMEDFLHDPAVVAQVHPEMVYKYRAGGSGRWFHFGWQEDDVHIDDFQYYSCPTHLQQHDRLLGMAYDFLLSQQPAPASPTEPLGLPESFETALKHLEAAAKFAVRYYGTRRVPLEALRGLTLKATRCPHCEQQVVMIKDEFIPDVWRFGRLASTYNNKAVNHCGHCGKVINRKVMSQQGVMLPGDLVGAWQN